MDALIDKLRKIGFTDYESKVYLALVGADQLTGYEVAKLSGIPKSNAYSALNSLTDKGFAYRVVGDSTWYQARDFHEIAHNLENDLEESLKYIEGHLPDKVSENNNFVTIEGHDKILDKVKHMILSAEKQIVLDIWSEDLNYFYEELLLAKGKGVRVILIIIGEIDVNDQNELGEIYEHGRDNRMELNAERNLTIVCDGGEALSGEVGRGSSRGLYSCNPSFVHLAIEALSHDILLQEAMKSCGQEVLERLKGIEQVFYGVREKI